MMIIVRMTKIWSVQFRDPFGGTQTGCKRDIAMFDLLVRDLTAPRNHSATISSTTWLHTLPNDPDYTLFPNKVCKYVSIM